MCQENFEDKMVYLHAAGQYLLKYLNTDPSSEDWAGIVSYGSMLTTSFPDSDPGDDNEAAGNERCNRQCLEYATQPGNCVLLWRYMSKEPINVGLT